ncbi:TadE/TadG family type IV pilus assembly protein [Pseudaminobacter soli (ex Li et al. 2025)]|uniref:Pilus assembly protein n=1 Tax=Pseudaminobacter soli (ex Li et al. 2025) TaxID=1295366 RepID=A0A2P7S5C6_9HYPH|nr:TadE/TadG family type IV pilus assembly protein [Mesorhizobium soli]PSJ57642.1 pilus assembly protein [Mesorhizobium soli]
MFKRFAKSQDGATMVEAAIVMTLLLVLTLGFVDFGNALYQWNSANKAVQVGARLASISDPVAKGLATAAPTDTPGAPVRAGAYSFECGYVAGALSCTSGAADANGFSRIFRGDTAVTNNDACPAPTGSQRPGMCHFYPFLKRENVVVRYEATGLGFQGRGNVQGVTVPVPTITVSLRNVTFHFFFLQGLMNFANITMSSMSSTVTGEDLKSGAPT